MCKIAASVIDQITNSEVTTDGRHMVLWLRGTDGSETPMAMGCDRIPSLIDHCALAASQSERILRTHNDTPPDRDSAAVTWWNSSVDRRSGELTLALTFGRGGNLSFTLTDHMAKALLTTLRSHYALDNAMMVAGA